MIGGRGEEGRSQYKLLCSGERRVEASTNYWVLVRGG